MVQTGELGRHVGVSLMRVLIGYVCGCLLGVGLGAAIGRFRVFRELVEPLIELIRRSEEHTSGLQSLMRISYAVFCLKKKTIKQYMCNSNILSRITLQATNILK